MIEQKPTVYVKYTAILYSMGDRPHMYRSARRRRILTKLSRETWEEAHIVATYSDHHGKRLGVNRCICKSAEDVATAFGQFSEQELLDFIAAATPAPTT